MTYWEDRKSLRYYQVVRRWMNELGPQQSILDVGSGGCPISRWGNFHHRYAIDIRKFFIKDVECIKGDWITYNCGQHSLITCLQVIEHLDDDQVSPFVDKIFNHAEHIIISVPYKWKVGACPSHKQDPIDVSKLLDLVRRDPILLDRSTDRMVAQFHRTK